MPPVPGLPPRPAGSGVLRSWTPLTPEELGRLLPGYEILALHGRGAMGAVYFAVERAVDRPVALKLLPPELSAEPGFADRFQREARAMARLHHPGIVTFHAFGRTTAGHLFFTMEFVEGSTLASRIREPGTTPGEALRWAGEIGAALDYAHRQGVVHRDIKPANVLIDAGGHAKVTDFGLARLLDPTLVEPGHTETGTVFGTPEYMAPEQRRGLPVDARTDLYSLGVLLYEMLCREPPQGAFPPPSRIAGCPEAVDRIVARAMQPKPEDRYPTAADMNADLEAAARNLDPAPRRRPSPRRKRLAAAGVAAGLLLVLLVLRFVLADPAPRRVPPSAPLGTRTSEAAPAAATVPVPTAWVDGLAALREGAIPTYLGTLDAPAAAREEYQSTNLLHEVDGTLRFWQGSFIRLPGPAGPPMRDQAVRLTFRGDRWFLGLRQGDASGAGTVRGPGLRIERGTDGPRLQGSAPGTAAVPSTTVPWPSGFDWNTSHTVELRAVGPGIAASLDGHPLPGLEAVSTDPGHLVVEAGAGGVIERMEFAHLDPDAPAELAGRFPVLPTARPRPPENTPGTAWLDAFAALQRNEIPVYAWSPPPPGERPSPLGPRGVLREHLTRDPEGRLQLRRDTGAIIPGWETPQLNGQALRVGFRGTRWILQVRNTQGPFGPSAYALVLDQAAPDAVLGRVHRGSPLKPLATAPLPVGFDWSGFHTVELRAVQRRLTVWIDDWKLLELDDDTLATGRMFLWGAAGGVLDRLEYANLEAFDPPLPSSAVVALAGHRYQFVAAPAIGWDQARTRAQNLGGHLVTITSESEAGVVRDLCRDAVQRMGGGGQVWLGGRRPGSERDGWRWVTGEPFEFTDWTPASPDSTTPGAALTLMAGPRQPGWNDFERPHQGTIPVNLFLQGFVVEWEPAE